MSDKSAKVKFLGKVKRLRDWLDRFQPWDRVNRKRPNDKKGLRMLMNDKKVFSYLKYELKSTY